MTPVLTILANFNGASGQFPNAGLIADAAGNLFGTTATGGAYGYGAVFELVNNGGGGYTPVTLLSFSSTPGVAGSRSGVIADAAGNLFGTIPSGGAAGDGAVFELVKHGGAYTAVTLAQLQRRKRSASVCRADRRRRREPLRHDGVGRGERRWRGVRDRQSRRRLRQHAHHTIQLRRRRWGSPGQWSDRRRRRGSLRHDTLGRSERLRRGVPAGETRRRLRAGHAGQLRRRRRGVSGWRSDHRRRREPLRHDILGRGVRLWRGVRARKQAAASTRRSRCSASAAPMGRIRVVV